MSNDEASGQPSTCVRTLRLKVKAESYPWLNAAAREVNQVWNFDNEISARARPKWLSAYDLDYTITYRGRATYTVSIMEFHNGKVAHETQYFADPFEAPAWRRQWVQRTT